MIPGRGADKVLDDLWRDIDQGRDLLRILALQVGQETREIEVDMVPASLGLQGVLVRHDKIAEVVHYRVEHVGGNDTVPPSCFLPMCSCQHYLFAFPKGYANVGCELEALIPQ